MKHFITRIISLILGILMVLSLTAYAAQAAELAPVELNVVIPVSGSVQKDIGLIEARISEIAKEKINATVKITNISYANWTQQTNLMLASEEPIDILWLGSNYGYNSVVSRKQVIPLDALLDEYGADIKAVLGDNYLDICRVNGSIYGVPSTRDMAANYGVLMLKEYVDKYDIDLSQVTTPEAFTDVLKVIKENEPDMIPFAVPQNITPAEAFYYGKFDQLSDKFGVLRLADQNYEVLNLYETPEYAAILKLLHEWYEAGYISSDAATTQDGPRELFAIKKAFSFPCSMKPGVETAEQRVHGQEMVRVTLSDVIACTNNVTVMMAGIPVTSKNPERAMMLLNLWYSDPDIVNAYDCGIEGIHYQILEDGSVYYPDGASAATTGYSPTAYFIGNNFLSHIWKGDPMDLWAQTEAFNLSATQSPAIGFAFSQDPVRTEIAAVQSVVTQYRKGLETGTLDPETMLPQYQEALKAAGIETIIAEKQRQLNEWVAENK